MNASGALRMPLLASRELSGACTQEPVCGLPDRARADGSLVELVLLHKPRRLEPVRPPAVPLWVLAGLNAAPERPCLIDCKMYSADQGGWTLPMPVKELSDLACRLL